MRPGHGDSYSAATAVAGAAVEICAAYFADSDILECPVEFVAGSADIVRCSVADLRIA